MKAWIGDFRLESTLILPADVPELRMQLSDAEFCIQNASKDDLPNEALAAQIIVQAETIADAEELAKTRMREMLDALSFVTSAVFRISRQRFLMDWSPGPSIREQYAYGYDNRDGRFPELADDYLATVNTIESLGTIKWLRNPLRWFAAGVGAKIAEDQFQYFWFVLELIAEMTKENKVVADKCQKCRSDLFCPTCNAVSEHRLFQKQAIEGLLSQLGVSGEMQEDLFKIRNGIMHGRDRSETLAEIRTRNPDFEFGDAIDVMWQVAMAAIFNALQIKDGEHESLTFGARDSVVSQDILFKAHMQIGMYGDPNNPQLKDVVLPRIRAIPVNARGEEIDPLTGDIIEKPQ